MNSAENVTLGTNFRALTNTIAGNSSSGNIFITALASNTANSIDIGGGLLQTNSNGLLAGSIILDGSAAGGKSIVIGSTNPVTLSALGLTGSVTVASNNNLTVLDKSSITAGQSVSLLAGEGTATTPGTPGSALTIGKVGGTGGAITANDGNILIQTDASSTTPTAGTILFGNAYNVTANALAVPFGNVTIAVDQASGATGAFPPTANYSVAIGAGGGSITATGGATPLFTATLPGSSFNANFANLTIFNNGSTGAGAITFDGKNAITADPPAPPTAPTIMAVSVLLPAQNTMFGLPAGTPAPSNPQASMTGGTTGPSGMQVSAGGNDNISSQGITLPAGTINTINTMVPAAYGKAITGKQSLQLALLDQQARRISRLMD